MTGWQFDLVFVVVLVVLVVGLVATGKMIAFLEWFERMLTR